MTRLDNIDRAGHLQFLEKALDQKSEFVRESMAKYVTWGNTFNPNIAFQQKMVRSILSSDQNIYCLEAATGAGKTIVAMMVGQKLLDKGDIIYVCHSTDILSQVREKASMVMPELTKYISPINDFSKVNRIHLLTPRALCSERKRHPQLVQGIFQKSVLFVVDEAHHFPLDDIGLLKIYGHIEKIAKEHFSSAGKKVLAMTATHGRSDGLLPMGKAEPDYRFTIQDSNNEGHCPDIYGIQIRIEIEPSAVLRAGDHIDVKFDTAAKKTAYIEAVAKSILMTWEKCPKPFCAFTTRIADAELIADRFNEISGLHERGVAVLVGKTSQGRRREIIDGIRQGNLTGYITCKVGGEGIDIRELEVAHLIGRTSSTACNIQRVGRTLRVCEGKTCALVIDYHFEKDDIIKGCVGLIEYGKAAGSRLIDLFFGNKAKRQGPLLVQQANETATLEWMAKVSTGDKEEWIRKTSPYNRRKRGATSLLDDSPDIAALWHPTKNGTLTPQDVPPMCGNLVWWKCKRGHEWQKKVSAMVYNHILCPKCYGKGLDDNTRLSVAKPELAQEWHPTKNGSLTPDEVSIISVREAWWKCKEGHEWKRVIAYRCRGHSDCPVCSGKIASPQNCLAAKHPALAAQWHPDRNGRRNPYNTLPGSSEFVWWKCEHDHEWIARIASRTRAKNSAWAKCPICSGKKLIHDKSLAVLHPKLLAEWHPTKNEGLDPHHLHGKSGKTVWWRCERGHEWQARIIRRTKYETGCPYCTNKKLAPDNSLSFVKPSLVSEWHPTKNLPLTPDTVIGAGDKRYWWKCEKGHEWQAKMCDRVRKDTGCPYCKGRRVYEDNCLSSRFPALAQEWHPTKNLPLTPDAIYSSSSKPVWWKCEKGHEWQAPINTRSRKNRAGRNAECPYCSHQLFDPSECLAILEPELSKQFHGVKNHPLTTRDVPPWSSKRVWWKCEKGHEWQSAINGRTSLKKKKNGKLPICPVCFGLIVTKDTSISSVHPDVAKLWHPDKNGAKRADSTRFNATARVWWKCEKGHEWQTSVRNQVRLNICPVCCREQRSAVKFQRPFIPLSSFPNLIQEWHPNKNGEIAPATVHSKSAKNFWWICKKGHEWRASVSNRTNGTGCPYCANRKVHKENCLAFNNPSVAAEWHPTKNGDLTPDKVVIGSHKIVWWKCKRGHEWQGSILKRARNGNGCPVCSGHLVTKDNCLATTHPHLAAEWHPTRNGKLTPQSVVSAGKKRIWWKCGKCNHSWRTAIVLRKCQNTGCPQCAWIQRAATKKSKWAPFDEALNIIKPFNIRSHTHWRQFSKTNQKPANIPSNPYGAYRSEWVSWPHWFGKESARIVRKPSVADSSNLT